jgi:hypothetical protein
VLDPFRRIASACRSFRRVSGWLLVLATVPWSALAQISPPTLADGTLNVAYAPVPFAASGATTWSWAPQAGWILPPGLSLNVAVVLAGTPTRGGNFAFRVTANLSAGGSLVQDFTLNVTSPPGHGDEWPDAARGRHRQAYAAQLTASGGSPFPAPVASYLWLLYDGTPPTGLSLGPDGRITRTPAASVPPGPQADFQVAACDFTYPVPQCGSRAHRHRRRHADGDRHTHQCSPTAYGERRTCPSLSRYRWNRSVHLGGDRRHAAGRHGAGPVRRADRNADRDRDVRLR